MSTATDAAVATHDHDEGKAHATGHDHPSDMLYVKVALILAAITGLETFTYFESVFEFGEALVPVLLVCMAAKFYLIARYFMHLKFDNKVLQRFFLIGLMIALAVYMAVLVAFKYFHAVAPK
jgi:cytochrome c oxidase subunit 4